MFRITNVAIKMIFTVGLIFGIWDMVFPGSATILLGTSAHAGGMTELKVTNRGFLTPTSIRKGSRTIAYVGSRSASSRLNSRSLRFTRSSRQNTNKQNSLRRVTRSVLDGGYSNAGNVRNFHGSTRSSRTAAKNQRLQRKTNGMRAIAGGRHHQRTVRGRARGPRDYRIGNFRGRSMRGFVILNLGAGHSHGMDQIAGNGGGVSDDNCAYGTYCTIDLGGPKIITFNDVADIQEGQYSDEQELQGEK